MYIGSRLEIQEDPKRLALGPCCQRVPASCAISIQSFFVLFSFLLGGHRSDPNRLRVPTSAEQFDNATMQENLAYLVSLIFEPSCFFQRTKMSIPYNPIIGL